MGKSSAGTIKVLLISEQAIVRAGLRLLIESRKEFRVVGEATGRMDGLAMVAHRRPELMIFDMATNGQARTQLLSELLAAATHARALVLASAHDSPSHHDAARAGAMGVVLKEQLPETLFKAMATIHQGEVWFDRAIIAEVLTSMAREMAAARQGPEAIKINRLTAREREITALVAAGLKNKAIAKHLFISEPTVRHHLSSAFSKLGVADRYELIIYAFRHGLADLPR
jgi:two-component system nitrate/nitrite response regulator NarL